MNIFFTRDPRGLLFRTPQSAHSRARTRVTVQHHVHAVKGIPIFHIACIGRYGHTRTFFCFLPSHTLPDEWTSTFDSTTLALATVFQCCTVVRRWADRASAPMGVSLDSPRSPTAGKVRSASIHASRVSASFLPFRVTHVARPNNKLPVCQKKLSSSHRSSLGFLPVVSCQNRISCVSVVRRDSPSRYPNLLPTPVLLPATDAFLPPTPRPRAQHTMPTTTTLARPSERSFAPRPPPRSMEREK